MQVDSENSSTLDGRILTNSSVPPAYRRNSFDPAKDGKEAWEYMFQTASTFSPTTSRAERIRRLKAIHTWLTKIPCETCKMHSSQNLNALMRVDESVVANKANALTYLWVFRNLVNQQMHRPLMSAAAFRKKYGVSVNRGIVELAFRDRRVLAPDVFFIDASGLHCGAIDTHTSSGAAAPAYSTEFLSAIATAAAASSDDCTSALGVSSGQEVSNTAATTLAVVGVVGAVLLLAALIAVAASRRHP